MLVHFIEERPLVVLPPLMACFMSEAPGKTLTSGRDLEILVTNFISANRTTSSNTIFSFYIGWSYEEVLPFFKQSEDNRDYNIAKDTYHHSVGGPLPVQKPKFMTPVTDAFLVSNYAFIENHNSHYFI